MEGLDELLKTAKLRKTEKTPQQDADDEQHQIRTRFRSAAAPTSLEMYQPSPAEEQRGMNMLHVALIKNASIDAIREIVKSNPEMLHQADSGGLTPLHRTVYVEDFFFNEKIFFFLLQECPEAARIPSKEGVYPLHSSCRCINRTVSFMAHKEQVRSKHPKIVQALRDAFPEALGEKTDNLQTPLHVAMHDRAPPDIVKVLLCEDVIFFNRALRTKDKIDLTPLLTAIKYNAPIESLQMVLRTYPEAAAIYDWESGSWKKPPSSLVVTKSSDGDVLAVTNIRTESTISEDVSGRLGNIPIHLAIRNRLPTNFLLELLNAKHDASKIRDLHGGLPLHLALLNDCELRFISELIRVFPEAIGAEDPEGLPILHMALQNSQIDVNVISLIVGNDPQVVHTRKQSKYVLPLHVGLAHAVNAQIITLLLQEYPDAAKIEDYYDNNELPLHLALRALETCCQDRSIDTRERVVNILNSIEMVLKAYPQAANARDNDLQTAMFRYCRILRSMENKTTRQCIDLMGELHKACPSAVEITCSGGASPINILVDECVFVRNLEVANDRYYIEKLRIVIKALRDGRALRPLCGVSGWRSHREKLSITHPFLKISLLIFDESNDRNGAMKDPNYKPRLDLNRVVIPGWTLLEILADFDTIQSSDILLQIVLSQKKKLKLESEIAVTLESDGFKISTSFVSIRRVDEAILVKVADRAKLSKTSQKLKRWGQEYGRFLRRYRIDAAPKHVSETCLVVFGTEAHEDVVNGRQLEAPVALKFMHSEAAFHTEIQKREKTDENFVIPIKAIYSQNVQKQICCDHIPECFLGVHDLHEELIEYLEIEVRRGKEFSFMMVMERGAGVDLHDVINHRNIAGRDVASIVLIALEIAQILRFMNETCFVIHGVRLTVEVEFRTHL